jgi:diguanylate cyclase (GGDEF)-like protein
MRITAFRTHVAAFRYRLLNNFELAVFTMLGAIVLVGIPPFAILRFLNGQWAAFFMDLSIELGILGGVVYSWKTGNLQRTGIFIACFNTVAAIGASFLLGMTGAYWLFPAMSANFFLVDRRLALGAIVVTPALLTLGGVFHTGAEAMSFAATLLVNGLFTFAFAHRAAQQRDQLETLASKDALTGAYNRRALLEELERSYEMHSRDGQPRGLFMLDIDHFKRINDQFGHLTGDHVLVRLVRILEKSVRKSDRLFRFGGEEFTLLTGPTTIHGLTTTAERLRHAVEQQLCNDSQAITVSIGGAILRPGESTESWFARADTALYSAKSAGRNRVVIDPAE